MAAPALERLREAVKLDPEPPFARRLALADALLVAGDEGGRAPPRWEEAAAAAQNESDLGEADDKFYNLIQAAGAAKMSPAVAAAGFGWAVRRCPRATIPACAISSARSRQASRHRPSTSASRASNSAPARPRRPSRPPCGDCAAGATTPCRCVSSSPVWPPTPAVARQAVTQLEKLAELVPAQRWAYRRRAALLRLDEPGRGDEALVALRAILEANPGSAEATADLAGALSRLNRWYDASQMWEKAVALAPHRACPRRTARPSPRRAGKNRPCPSRRRSARRRRG